MERVLIVDDDDDLRRALTEAIKSIGNFDIHSASGGGEALELLGEFKYQTLLLDINMPDIDGVDVLKRLMADHTLHRPERTVVITALGRGSIVDAAATALGADTIIYKPFQLEDLVAVLKAEERDPVSKETRPLS